MVDQCITSYIMKLDGARLKTERLKRGWNQSQVARKCKPRITTATVSNAENSNDVHPATALAICTVFGIEIEDVMLPMEGVGAA